MYRGPDSSWMNPAVTKRLSSTFFGVRAACSQEKEIPHCLRLNNFKFAQLLSFKLELVIDSSLGPWGSKKSQLADVHRSGTRLGIDPCSSFKLQSTIKLVYTNIMILTICIIIIALYC